MAVEEVSDSTIAIPTGRIGGVRAGLIVLAGVAALNLGNYVFHVVSARRLGPSGYSDLATLLTLSSLISLPLGGVQMWVARHIAQARAADDLDAARWFARRVAIRLALIGVCATALGLALAWPLQKALGIHSFASVALTALTIFPAVVTPLVWGITQGLERFGTVALAYASGPVTRLAFVGVAFAAGAQVGGAMLATLASMIAALLLPLVSIKSLFAPPVDPRRRLVRRDAIRSLLPVMLGLLAVTALTSDDVVVAKLALSSHEAGIYGSASLVGRVILYLPAAVATVLLPRVAVRVAGRRDTHDLLARSMWVTVAFCTFGIAFYAVAGGLITRVAFGAKYSEAVGLLWLFAIAMSGFAILNLLLIYHLARGHNKMSWLLLVGAVSQTALFVALHRSGKQLVVVDIAVAAALIVAHEILLGGMLSRSLIPPRFRRAARQA